MILNRKIVNNGYGCSCCAYEWESNDLIKNNEVLTINEIIDQSLKCKPYKKYGDIITNIYEENGKILYGYKLDVYRSYYTINIIIDNNIYQLDHENSDEDDTKGMTKEEILYKIDNLSLINCA